MEKELIKKILSDLEKDYMVGNCYREDSVKSCLYFSIRNYFLKENEKIAELENKIFVYPEIRNFLDKEIIENTENEKEEKSYRERFDLVISKGFLENFNTKKTKICGYDGIFDIIEIKYINGKNSQILESLEADFNKLAKLDETKAKNISKNLFFIFEHKSEILDELKKDINEKFKNNRIKIFGLFIDLCDSYKIETFEN